MRSTAAIVSVVVLATSGFERAAAEMPCDDALGNGMIGIYTDATATSSCITELVGTPTLVHVIFTLEGQSSGGITGLEFRIEESAPSGYFMIWNANAALFSTVIGSPLDETPGVDDARGVTMASNVCQPS